MPSVLLVYNYLDWLVRSAVCQVNDVSSLRDENKRLMIIAQQLEPYIRSITALMERISPKLQVRL